jgi:hypothetical protein
VGLWAGLLDNGLFLEGGRVGEGSFSSDGGRRSTLPRTPDLTHVSRKFAHFCGLLAADVGPAGQQLHHCTWAKVPGWWSGWCKSFAPWLLCPHSPLEWRCGLGTLPNCTHLLWCVSCCNPPQFHDGCESSKNWALLDLPRDTSNLSTWFRIEHLVYN